MKQLLYITLPLLLGSSFASINEHFNTRINAKEIPSPTSQVFQNKPPFAAPNITWSRLYGGSNDEYCYSMTVTPEGGYVMVGDTKSKDGDFAANKGKEDAWIIKLDENGNKQWSKLLGGSARDFARSVITTPDGGFVVSGNSESNDGDLTGNHGHSDAWVIKLDATGNVKWSRLFGGDSNDIIYSIATAKDGGFILVGVTQSKDGDVLNNHGSQDAWVLKLDESGNKQWSKLFGGSSLDYASSIVVDGDGSYLFAGFTTSMDGDVAGNDGYTNAWVLKLDQEGNKIWSKLFGGNREDFIKSIAVAQDGGYLLAGSSASNDSDFTGNQGNADVWVQKIDKSGNKVWSKIFGGSYSDLSFSVIGTADGGCVLTGYTESKDGDFSTSHGSGDAWVAKLDKKGNKTWIKALGGSMDDEARSVVVNSKGELLIAGFTDSNDGNISGNTGFKDGWILKLKP